MTELKTSIVVDLAGNLARNAKKYTDSLGNFSKKGRGHLSRLGRTAGATGRMLDKAGNRYTALLTGAVGVGAGKMVISLERRFTRLGIQANKSADEMNLLKKEIYDAANAPDIRVNPDQITSAIEEIVEKTGDLEFARKNIRNIGAAIQATGAQGVSIGGIMAEFQKMGITQEQQVLKAIDLLNVQGKAGAFTLQNLASLGPRVITAYTSMGRGGVGAIKEMGAALQMIRMGTGSSEQAATAFEALLRTLGDKKKVAMLQKGGIKVFDPEELKKGKEVLRPINELMVEIIKTTGGKKTVLSKVFDAEAVRAFNAASSEFQRTNAVASMDKFMNVTANGETTLKDSARAAKDAAGSIEMLSTAWKKFADESLTGPLQDAADLLNQLGSENTGKILKYLVVGGAGALVAGKTYKAAAWAKNKLTGKGGKGSSGGNGGGPIPLPVYVVNKHLSLTPDSWGGGAGGKGGAGKGKASLVKRLGGKAMSLAKYAGPLAVGAASYQLTSMILGDLPNKLGAAVYRALHDNPNEATVKLEIESKDAKVKTKAVKTEGMDVDVSKGLLAGGAL